MIGSNLKLALIEQIDSQAEPVLSLYLNVNPAHPDNTEKAVALRAAEAMRQVGVAKEYITAITTRLRKHFVRPERRTLVIFACEDHIGQLDVWGVRETLLYEEWLSVSKYLEMELASYQSDRWENVRRAVKARLTQLCLHNYRLLMVLNNQLAFPRNGFPASSSRSISRNTQYQA